MSAPGLDTVRGYLSMACQTAEVTARIVQQITGPPLWEISGSVLRILHKKIKSLMNLTTAGY